MLELAPGSVHPGLGAGARVLERHGPFRCPTHFPEPAVQTAGPGTVLFRTLLAGFLALRQGALCGAGGSSRRSTGAPDTHALRQDRRGWGGAL